MKNIVFWLSAFAGLIMFLVFFSKTLLPFFVAFIFAYLLHPIVSEICKRYNISRSLASSFIFIIVLSIFALVALILMPIIYQQLSILITKIPIYRHYIQTELVPVFAEKIQNLDPKISDKVTGSMQNFVNNFFLMLASLFNNLWGYTVATLNVLVIILLVPIILLYLLRDWPKVISCLDNLLPVQEKAKIRQVLFSINNLLSAYIRGQFNVCVILSTYYGIGLSILGIDLGLLIGIISGFLVIIPFIGVLISFLLAIIISYFSFGATIKLIYIIILYALGYAVEGYILTPKIIGNRIGLHPLWIMFSVFITGSLFGFVGIFFAIPLAGIIKVLLGYGIEYYKLSNMYDNSTS
ncbi:MAG: AI-2E family transporter [Janthinobacterium lividum]